MCDHARCPADRYVLINAPLPHSPGAITAIIAGPCIFSARTRTDYTHRGREAEEEEGEEEDEEEGDEEEDDEGGRAGRLLSSVE